MKNFLLFIILICVSCSKPAEETAKLKVASTNYPVKWLIDYISGQTVENIFLIPDDIDPAYWEPSDTDLQSLNDCDMVFLNGATYEKWMNTASLGKTFDTSAKFKDKFIAIKDVMEHEHNGKKHSHDGIDFNTWLNFDLFIQQAEAVEKKLSTLIKSPEVDFAANLKSLKSELNELKSKLSELTTKQKTFFASHPVYDYMAQAYGLKIQNFHWEPEQTPSEAEWQKLKEVKEHSSYMLWEDMPNDETRKKLIAMDIKIIVFRTCGNTPPSEDFIKEMKSNLENLKLALEQ